MVRNVKKVWYSKYSSLETVFDEKLLSQLFEERTCHVESKYKPFWCSDVESVSSELWMPSGHYSSEKVISAGKKYYEPEMGCSWFNIKEMYNAESINFEEKKYKYPQEYKDPSVNPENLIKSLKFLLLLEDGQKTQVDLWIKQWRWYFNFMVDVYKKEHDNDIGKMTKKKCSAISMRNLALEYTYQERWSNDKKSELIKKVVRKIVPDREIFRFPEWKNMNGRVWRGAIDKFTESMNSIISNYKAGNIKSFVLSHLSEKKSRKIVHFEDCNFPAEIKKFKSRYWYTDTNGKRRQTTFSSVFNTTKKRGLEIIREENTERYFLHYPVDTDWFPENDRRVENQDKYVNSGKRGTVAIDPGVRKPFVGYDPTGKTIFFGDGASRVLSEYLYKIDSENRKKEHCDKKLVDSLWARIKNMVDDLQWKTISYLIRNYYNIIYTDYRVSQMVKSKKLPPIIKRLMLMFSSYKFKMRLAWKCTVYGKKLYIVDESYTSRTCGSCGYLHENLGKDETFECPECNTVIDRDINGARNILLKNIRLR